MWFWIRLVNYSPCPSISSLETLVRIGRIGFADESSDSCLSSDFQQFDWLPSWERTNISPPSRHFWVDDFPFPVWWDMVSRSLEGHFFFPFPKNPPYDGMEKMILEPVQLYGSDLNQDHFFTYKIRWAIFRKDPFKDGTCLGFFWLVDLFI